MSDEQPSFFEQERLRYADEISKSFETLLDNANSLNRKLEEVTAPSIRNELKSIANLWMSFHNLMRESRNEADAHRLGQMGMPGTGGYIAGQDEGNQK